MTTKHTTPDGPRHEAHASRRSVGRPLPINIMQQYVYLSVCNLWKDGVGVGGVGLEEGFRELKGLT